MRARLLACFALMLACSNGPTRELDASSGKSVHASSRDAFDADLAGFSFWTDAPEGTSHTYALTLQSADGATAPCAEIAGDYAAGTPRGFGMSKTVAIAAMNEDLVVQVDYRAFSSSATATNALLEIRDGVTDALLAQQPLLEAQSTDTTWRSRTLRLPALHFTSDRSLKVILSLRDASLGDTAQRLRIDNVSLRSEPPLDTFDADTSGWTLFAELPNNKSHTYALSAVTSDGLPPGSAQVSGNYGGSSNAPGRFGLSKVWSVAPGTDRRLLVDYRSRSSGASADTNGAVRLVDADTGSTLLDTPLFTDRPKDTGWRRKGIDVAASLIGAATRVRVVFYLLDSSSSNRSQVLSIDNVSFPASAPLVEDVPLWKQSSPTGMVQQPLYDEYARDGLRYRLYGWRYVTEIFDGANTLTVTPRKEGAAPIDVSQNAGVALLWTVTPLSLLHANAIQWTPTVRDTGFYALHLLEPGLLSATYTSVPAGVTLELAGTAAPTPLGPSLYALGAIRIRVVEGSVEPNGNALLVSAGATGNLQLLVYARPALDGVGVDAMGAAPAGTSGEVALTDGFKTAKSLRLRVPELGYDAYLAVDAAPASVSPGLLIDRGIFYVTDGSGVASGWALWKFNASIRKTGALTFRNFRYSHSSLFSSQTFNYYLNTSRGTQTFWSVGRLTRPYTVSYHPRSGVHLFYFPETEVDGHEDGLMLRTLRNATAIAFDNNGKVMMTAEKISNTVALSHTGTSGNSVDGGFRHILTGPKGDVRMIKTRNGTWTDRPQAPDITTGVYTYTTGDAGYVTGSQSRYLVMKRLWTGAWQTATDLLPTFVNQAAAANIFGFMKNVGSSTPAGSTVILNHVVQLDRGVIPDAREAEATYRRFEYPAVPTVEGMIDLGSPAARTSAPWDLGYAGDEPHIVVP